MRVTMRWVLMLSTLALLAAPLDGASQASPSSSAGKAGAAAVAVAPLRIVALGDSLTSGHRLPQGDAYPAVLERQLREAGVPAAVVNHGRNRDTSADALRRVDAALAEDPDILIVALGANDGLRGVPVDRVRDNLEKIVEKAQDRDVRVLLVGMEALPLYGWKYTVDFHHVFPRVAEKYKVPLVPFMLQGVIGNPDLMSSDGVHPNAAGARMIASTILPYVKPLVGGSKEQDPPYQPSIRQ